jgi:hypothetical protein
MGFSLCICSKRLGLRPSSLTSLEYFRASSRDKKKEERKGNTPNMEKEEKQTPFEGKRKREMDVVIAC